MHQTKMTLIMVTCLAALAPMARSQDHARLGNEAFGQGNFHEAIDHYTQALRSKPSFALYANLGHCYTRLERWSDAASAYQAAIDLDGESAGAQIWRFLGQSQYNDGRFQQAMKAFFEAASLKSDDQDNMWIARCMIELDQWLQAKSVLLGHLQRNPTDTGALELLAYVIGQQDDRPGVIDVYRQLLTMAPERAQYRIALANALTADGQNKQAIDTLEFAWRVDKSLSRRINRLLADLYLAEEMPQEAAACYARLTAISDNPSADDYYRLGVTYFQTGELTSAETAFTHMLKADPANSESDLYLGHVAAQQGDFDKARLHYKTAIEKKPTVTEAFVALANLQMKSRQYNDAAAYFAKAIQLGDNRPLVHYNHILALMRQADVEQAKAALKRALAEHPSQRNLLRLLDQCVEEVALKQDD